METMDIFSRLKLVSGGKLQPADAIKVMREALASENQQAVDSAFAAVRERTWMYVKQSSPVEAARLWLNAIQQFSALLLDKGQTSLAERLRGMSELLLHELDHQVASNEVPTDGETEALLTDGARVEDAEGTVADPKWVEQIDADVNFLERMVENATKGLYVAMDCRHCAAPADCVEYAVVSAEAGREVSRVWTEDDARFQAAASPARIARLVTAHRQLRGENAALKSGAPDGVLIQAR